MVILQINFPVETSAYFKLSYFSGSQKAFLIVDTYILINYRSYKIHARSQGVTATETTKCKKQSARYKECLYYRHNTTVQSVLVHLHKALKLSSTLDHPTFGYLLRNANGPM